MAKAGCIQDESTLLFERSGQDSSYHLHNIPATTKHQLQHKAIKCNLTSGGDATGV